MRIDRRHSRVPGHLVAGVATLALNAMLATAASAAAQADTSSAPVEDAAQAQVRSDQISDIVVTARRRSESLERVPISVSAFSGKALEAKQIQNVFSLAQYTPNVQFSGAGAASAAGGAFYIRGIGQFNVHTTSDPAVGVYFDGVYMARTVGSNYDLGDIAQVEVLKGPQGTLFGRNTIAGAVSITTNKPVFDEFSGRAEANVGNIDNLLARATFNVPLVDDRLAARITVMGLIRSGYGTDIGPDNQVYSLGRSRQLAGRVQLRWAATENLELLLAGDLMRARGHSLPGGLTHFNPTDQTEAYNLTAPVKIGPQWLVQGYDSFLNIVPDDDVDAGGASLTATWTQGDVTIKSISAYRKLTAVTAQDFGGVPLPWIAQQMDQKQWQVSQELQASGSLLEDKLKYTGGVYYFQEHSHNDTTAGLMGSLLLIPDTNTAKSYSAYGQATYNLTDKLSVTGGVRWTHERKGIVVETTLNDATVLPRSANHVTFQATSPMGSLQYQWSDGLMTYVSVSRGFRSGTFNPQPFSTTDLIPTFPEKATTYEAGVKFVSPNRDIRFNAAGFYDDYTNIQLGATTEENGVFIYRNANAAKAKIYGGEAELTVVPAKGVEAYLNASYLHSRLSAVPGFSFGVSRLPSAPKFMLQGGVRYGFDLASGDRLTLDGDASYRTGTYPQFNPAPPSRQSAYALANARIIFEPLRSGWSFTLWVKNLTDKKYKEFGQTSGSNDVTVGWFGRPREIGATAAVNF